MKYITFGIKLSTLIEYGVLLSVKIMSSTINYTALHLETLEVILVMHVNNHLQLLNNPEAEHQKILNLESTIEQVRLAISMKAGAVGCENQELGIENSKSFT